MPSDQGGALIVAEAQTGAVVLGVVLGASVGGSGGAVVGGILGALIGRAITAYNSPIRQTGPAQ